MLKPVGGTITLLVRLGVPVGPAMLLTVRGRKTGPPRTNRSISSGMTAATG